MFCHSDWRCSAREWRALTAENKVTYFFLIGPDGAERHVCSCGLVFQSILLSPSRYLAACTGTEPSSDLHQPWAEWEGAGRRWQGVGRGLSCDPDSCTSLCPGGQRRFSSYISLRAELLTVSNTVTEGEREKDTRANKKGEKMTLSSIVWQVLNYGLLLGYMQMRSSPDICLHCICSSLVPKLAVDLCCKGHRLCRGPCHTEVQDEQSVSGSRLSDSLVFLDIYHSHLNHFNM